MSYNLELLTKDLESSKSDRLMIHEELKRNMDERLDTHAEKLVEHTQQIKTLFRGKISVKRKELRRNDFYQISIIKSLNGRF